MLRAVLPLLHACASALETSHGFLFTLATLHRRRFEENYFAPFPGYFFTGDGARRDKDGYIWITGARVC